MSLAARNVVRQWQYHSKAYCVLSAERSRGLEINKDLPAL